MLLKRNNEIKSKIGEMRERGGDGGREKEIAPTFAQFGETILGLPPITVVVQINKFIISNPNILTASKSNTWQISRTWQISIQVKHMANT
jgi:hypothetical protein